MTHNLAQCRVLVKKAVQAGAKVPLPSPAPSHRYHLMP